MFMAYAPMLPLVGFWLHSIHILLLLTTTDISPIQCKTLNNQSIYLSIKAQLDFKTKTAVELLIIHADLSAATIDTARHH